MTTRPIADGLFTNGARPHLIGGRDRATDRIVFPCPTGRDGERYEPMLLSRTGVLWSWTIQRFRPKTPPYTGPQDFEPYAIGYVELPGQTIVETRLAGIAFADLKIGMNLELTTLPFTADADGTTVLTYAFQPEHAA